jgi:hypothetical protein
VATCLLAACAAGAAGNAARASDDPQAAEREPASRTLASGLVPPAIVMFDVGEGPDAAPVPNAAASAAASEAVSAAFLAAMAARATDLTVIGAEELGPIDRSPLDDLPGLLTRSDARPIPEAALSVELPRESLDRAMERHRLDAVWVVTGVVVLARGDDGSPGTRLLLRAALVDRQGRVLFSDLVDEDTVTQADLRDPEVARGQVAALLAEYRTQAQQLETERAATAAQEARAALPRSPHPGEFRLGVGVFFIAGVDLWAGYLWKNSHWQVGYRYVRWTDTFEDPYTGRDLTDTTETLHGPQVNYLFRPGRPGTWYVGASLMEWSKTESAMLNGVSDSDSVVAPFFGGGYTRRFAKHFYCNVAMFIGPGANLETDTGVSSEEASGGFDIQVQIGASF